MTLNAKKGRIRRQRLAGFLIERNLREIEVDAWGDWAKKETPEFTPIPPMDSQVWKPAPFRTFISQIMP